MSWREDEEHPKEFDDLLDHEDLDEGESSSVELDSDDEESMEIEELDTSGEEEEEWEENNEEDEVWEENNEKNQKLEPETPGLTPSTPPECRQSVPQMDEEMPHHSRDRSRSPVRLNFLPEEDAVVLVIGEDGVEQNGAGDFLAPDAHVMYVSPEERDRNLRNERYERRMSGRRGVRGARGQRGRGRGHPSQGRRGNLRWEVGHPLNEIWTTDADVPSELVSLARDVMRRRKESIQDAERNAERQIAVSESESDEEYLDALAGEDGLPRLESQNLHFEWSTMETFQGKEENFRQERTGSVLSHSSAYDAFRSFWGDDILDQIVTETNRYATKIVSTAFQSDWSPTNRHEILCLFSFWMMLGIIRMPTITSCFSGDPLMRTEVFKRIFTRRRYETLIKALNFTVSDPSIDDSNPSNTGVASLDRLHHLRPIITHLNSKFQSNYILDKDICIDQSLTLWKGKLNIKQYIRSNAAKFGIKTFELCESTTGYLWSFIVYTGKQSGMDVEQLPGVLKSSAIVKKLIGPLLNKGYRLFMDNWCNSPLLTRYLKLNGTDCVGTLRSSRADVPVVINKAPLKKGEYIARHSGDVSILSWQDKKRVTMISTCHDSSTALPTVSSRPKSRPIPFKPQMVLDYNKFMGGIDLKDQMLEPYLLERKRGIKWYMKLFKRLLNISILNARILLQSSTQKQQHHLAFRLQLVDSILTKHLAFCPKGRVLLTARTIPGRYTESTHWPALHERTPSSAARNRNHIKRCVVCYSEGRTTQRSAYRCESCDVPLCIINCFKVYHTRLT
ncbi:piggyBac transposable element-derived protein 4 isoform X2 [Bicyclus anynana]|nr:piggyBac transposable element-derived protein 4 isoform X2 [Bicyclus anynana]XP_023940981.1 piggyBac transposable element-derived protein 4 isoform X2 [Bicyclus anynana]XP_023940982.1 piggyBac transposable element-derived protein 4 isoform X2 [Bicyclus anynana]XP_052739770.1 piggyBac transposable element-derived protein 4 isoform X2 [Bicyclus anynana]